MAVSLIVKAVAVPFFFETRLQTTASVKEDLDTRGQREDCYVGLIALIIIYLLRLSSVGCWLSLPSPRLDSRLF